MNANIYTQILPVICMVLTLWLIRRNVDFQYVPGFDKIGSLVFFLTVLIILLWILKRPTLWCLPICHFLPVCPSVFGHDSFASLGP